MLKRRVFLTGLGYAAAAKAAPLPSAAASGVPKSTSGLPPRKVIVGTVMQSVWGPYPGLEKRLEQLAGIVDRMAQESKSRYGRGLDLAILPDDRLAEVDLAIHDETLVRVLVMDVRGDQIAIAVTGNRRLRELSDRAGGVRRSARHPRDHRRGRG